uniref:Uncharacterized protein n=1 Tax=viral metagenome TaxID=1070528 RepID=A0A6M3LW31_9ZZZZ
MTINLPIETYKRHLEALRILEAIVEYDETVLQYDYPAACIPNIEEAKKIVKELRST